jgi:hypothetical protein
VYLNVDLEIRSPADLTQLVRALQRRLFVLHAGRVRGTFLASFETSGVNQAPDVAIRRFASALRRLPRPLQRLWKQARERAFDIGVARAAGTTPFALALRPETLRTVCELNARLALTFYSQTWREPKQLPNEPLERAGMSRRDRGNRRRAGRSAPMR